MKLGLNLWIWESPFRTDLHLGLLAKAKSLGAETVEFAAEDDAIVDTKALRRALEDHGLGCSVVGLFGSVKDLSSNDRITCQRGMEYAKKCLEMCHESGATIYSGAVLGFGGTEALSPDVTKGHLQRASECLHEIGDLAVKAGVRFCVEVLNRYESNLVTTAAQGLELMSLTNHSAVGLHLDTFHMNMEEDSLGDAIRLVGDKLIHFHSSESQRGTPGTGHVEWNEVAQALKDINYEGYAVIESFNSSGRLAPHARFWRPFTDSPDNLAREGLKFLKSALNV